MLVSTCDNFVQKADIWHCTSACTNSISIIQWGYTHTMLGCTSCFGFLRSLSPLLPQFSTDWSTACNSLLSVLPNMEITQYDSCVLFIACCALLQLVMCHSNGTRTRSMWAMTYRSGTCCSTAPLRGQTATCLLYTRANRKPCLLLSSMYVEIINACLNHHAHAST